MRPRRTSEFIDETLASTAAPSARTSRTTTHRLQTTPGTAQKFLQRPTLGTRNSFDRGPANVLSATRNTNSLLSASRGATPLHQSSTRCALFTNGPNTAVALHNDKKWVQEQTQRITEHLKHAALLGHSSVDFINQTSLRQMSIKHFVSTINYFLQFAAGNRLSVGTNHVEDIVSILQKLHYPYAVNKSWLKTPNTQHSFGNVIVLFSYLMDFVPPPALEEQNEWLFALEESPDNLVNRSLWGWDPDFQEQMMQHCAEAFTLWDKQLMNEYADMQQQTCNLFIKKRSGMSNGTTLERAIDKLGNELEGLHMKCKPISKEQLQRQQQLQEEQQKLQELKQKCIAKLESLEQELEQINEDYHGNNDRILTLQQQINELKHQIQQQICTLQQRDILLSQLHELKIMFESEKRTLQTVQEQNYRQQIKLSRSKQQFTVEIEQFNGYMREISEIVQDCKLAKGKCLTAIANGELQLPLNVELKQLQYVKELLVALNKQIAKEMKVLQNELNELNKRLETTEMQVKEILQADYDYQASKLTLLSNALSQQQQQKLNEIKNLTEYYQQLQVEIDQHKLAIIQLNEENLRKQQDIKHLQQKHEQKLKETEVNHEKCMSILDEFYEKYETKLNENMKELTQLHNFLLQLEQ